MTYYFVDGRGLALLAAQARLNGTFQHACIGSRTGDRLPFSLEVTRGARETRFVVEMRDDRHTLTLPNHQRRTELCLSEFVEAIANGRLISAQHHQPHYRPETSATLKPGQAKDLLHLIHTGGFLNLDLGLPFPLQLALHHNQAQGEYTVVVSANAACPQTCSFIVQGEPSAVFLVLSESIEHLVACQSPTPAPR